MDTMSENIFKCELYVNNELIASSNADSKIDSEVLCAIDALKKFKKEG